MRTRRNAYSPPGRGRGWVGSWKGSIGCPQTLARSPTPRCEPGHFGSGLAEREKSLGACRSRAHHGTPVRLAHGIQEGNCTFVAEAPRSHSRCQRSFQSWRTGVGRTEASMKSTSVRFP